MEAIPFCLSHIEEARQWARARGLATNALDIPEETLQRCGLIVPGVACLFLFVDDAKMGTLDSLLANPDADAATRDAAIRLLYERLMEKAKSRGCKRVIAFTQIPAVAARMQRYGGLPLGEHIVYQFGV